MYDIETVPVPSAPAAGHFTVADGKITRIRLIFDRLPYEAAASSRQEVRAAGVRNRTAASDIVPRGGTVSGGLPGPS